MTREAGARVDARGTMGDDPVVIIGVGNVLLGDDGIGVRVIEALAEAAARDPGALPPGTRLIDGGTLGLALLGDVEAADALVLVDAVGFGAAPGTVTVLRGDRLTATDGPVGLTRSGGVGELMATARLLEILPRAVALVGIEAGEISAGDGLSRRVAAAVPAAVEAVRREAVALAGQSGFASRPAEVAGAAS